MQQGHQSCLLQHVLFKTHAAARLPDARQAQARCLQCPIQVLRLVQLNSLATCCSSTPRLVADPREAERERVPEPEGAAKYPPVAPWRRSGLDGSASRGNLVGLAGAGSGSGASDNDSDSGAQVRRRTENPAQGIQVLNGLRMPFVELPTLL